MDTLAKTAAKPRQQHPGGKVVQGVLGADHVARLLAEIRDYMPETYAYIQCRAAPGDLGSTAFSLVRRGLRGEANCFYASERGRTVGTPFAVGDPVRAVLVQSMVAFGASYWAMLDVPVPQGQAEVAA